LARDIDAERHISEANDAYAVHAFTHAEVPWPRLHLDDVSGIPFLKDILGVDLYQLRSRVRAETGDLFAATCHAMPDYEAYNTDRLGFGRPTFVQADNTAAPIEVAQACESTVALDTIGAHAQSGGGLVIHPYMGIEAVWHLAQVAHQHSGQRIQVLAPPPPITWFANDKCDLTEVTIAVAGRNAAVESRIATDGASLAADLTALAQRHDRVALKMGRCASAMGNHIWEASAVRAMGLEALQTDVNAVLTQKEWQPGERVLAVAWETATASPSTQLWIPPLGHGEPVLNGVYEQLLEGDEKVFLGSIPSRLGADVDRELARISLCIATVFQHLGYVGRCSFDFIVVDGTLKITECNGRWGGTSTPMHLMDRLFPSGRPFYRAQDYVDKALVGRSFADLAGALDDMLYDARTGEGRLVLYNVGCLPRFGKFDVIIMGDDLDACTEVVEQEIPTRLARLS